MKLAPIALFVYNRPKHTKTTVEALLKNPLAAESELFIFSDSFKAGAAAEAKAQVEEVRAYIRTIKGFQAIYIEENALNGGLANQIISKVSKVMQEYGQAIVLEDDVVPQPGFLTFMNDALALYKDNARIMSIGAWTPKINLPAYYKKDVFLAQRTCSWGWASWAGRWFETDWEMKDFAALAKDPRAIKAFNSGGPDLYPMLCDQMAGKIDAWDIRWEYAHFKNKGLVLRPAKSLTANIGIDGSGTHCGNGGEAGGQHNRMPLAGSQEAFRLPPNPKPRKAVMRQIYDYYAQAAGIQKTSLKTVFKTAVKAVLPHAFVTAAQNERQKRPQQPAYINWLAGAAKSVAPHGVIIVCRKLKLKMGLKKSKEPGQPAVQGKNEAGPPRR